VGERGWKISEEGPKTLIGTRLAAVLILALVLSWKRRTPSAKAKEGKVSSFTRAGAGGRIVDLNTEDAYQLHKECVKH